MVNVIIILCIIIAMLTIALISVSIAFVRVRRKLKDAERQLKWSMLVGGS